MKTATNTTATVKETAAAMRKALRVEFPGVRFSVRMSTGVSTWSCRGVLVHQRTT